METDDHIEHCYVRQKLWEAMGCLVGPKHFRDRMTAAAGPLTHLKYLHSDLVARLPDNVRSKFNDVIQLLTQKSPEWRDDSGEAASVRKLTPRQRRKIGEDILSMFVSVSGGL
jgi:hypothetical protein